MILILALNLYALLRVCIEVLVSIGLDDSALGAHLLFASLVYVQTFLELVEIGGRFRHKRVGGSILKDS